MSKNNIIEIAVFIVLLYFLDFTNNIFRKWWKSTKCYIGLRDWFTKSFNDVDKLLFKNKR